MATYYLQILSVQRPFAVGSDGKNRHMFSVNFRATARAPVEQFENEMVKILSDAELATIGTTAFIGPLAVIPDGDGPFILIRDTGGVGPFESHNGTKLENLSCQIVVYAASYLTGRTRALAIWRALDGKRRISVAA